MATDETTMPVFSWKQQSRIPEPLPEARWEASVDINGRHLKLMVDNMTSTSWYWSVDLRFEPFLSVLGSAPDLESAQKEAQAVCELFATGRPLHLDREPTRTVSAGPEVQSANPSVLVIENREYRSFTVQTPHDIQMLLGRLDTIKQAVLRRVTKHGDESALEPLGILEFITGDVSIPAGDLLGQFCDGCEDADGL